MGKAPAMVNDALPSTEGAAAAVKPDEEEPEVDIEAMRHRLEALKS